MSKASTKTTINNAEKSTINDAEIEKFSKMSAEWWDPLGKFKPLHKFNPIRLQYLKNKLCSYFQRDAKSLQPLKGLKILDIGCGGGLLSEPLTRLGAEVTGVDASALNISIARQHAEEMGLQIDYRISTAEDLLKSGEKFDVVLNMEVIEHVDNVDFFMESCAALVKKDGLMFLATINRTLKAWALAIIGVEYILNWLPRGTHQYEKFITPTEAKLYLKNNGFKLYDETGVCYNPIKDVWSLTSDMSVNYILCSSKEMEHDG